MEPDILTYQHPSARPSLDDDIEEVGSDEDEFRGFSRGLAASTDPTVHLKRSCLHQTKPLPLTNGFCNTPEEEVGFADFAVFAEQAAHPWCCGFTGATTPSNGLREARDVVMDSEPRSSRHRLDLRTQDAPRISPASEEQDSVSFEGPSEDSEPNVSSLASHEDHTDDDNDDLMVEDGRSASQGTCPTSKQPSQFLSDNSEGLPGLPPSESFADFCSAATQQDGGEKWDDFKDQSNHMQQLLLTSFPETVVPPVSKEDDDEVVLSLEALLHPQQRSDCEEDTVERVRSGFWLPHQEMHCAAGLNFRWGTSHANRTLLRCLGMVSQNMETNKDCYRGHTRNHLQGHKTHTQASQ
ncbi:uncharacterized protein LOC144000985 [Festucalex cinctus]